MAEPLLIKRYASRRLYNTETSDYVTLEDIAQVIRGGRAVKIVDLKSGDDLTRQYLLQIIAEHEGRGQNVLPIDVLTDLVRSYTTQAQSIVPDFLAMSFEMLKQGQSKMVENMAAMNPMTAMPGFENMRAQQEAFMKAMTGGFGIPWGGDGTTKNDDTQPQQDTVADKQTPTHDAAVAQELDDIKRQLAELQDKLKRS